VLLLGPPAVLQKGLTESLAGRFLLSRCPHWSYAEVARSFGTDLDRWVYFGGYPGGYALADDEQTWGAYVRDSLHLFGSAFLLPSAPGGMRRRR
jgi:hypothetical protein